MTAHAGPPPPPLARAELDRRAEEREVPGLLEDARADPGTRVLVVRGDAAPLGPGEPPSLRYATAAEVAGGGRWAFLGRDPAGDAVLLAAFDRDAVDPVRAPDGWGSLREIGGDLSAFDAGVLVEGVSLGRWLVEAPCCSGCGTHAEVTRAGWARACPACGREHFPRTDPAVIVAVESGDGERLLLGANALWGGDRYSCFAGFVEAGESLESTVHREVREEAGVRLRSIRYSASQAWPYPRSLMIGFHARAVDDAEAKADGSEILRVRWFTRAELGAALAGDGDVSLPGPASIARSLISGWQAGAA